MIENVLFKVSFPAEFHAQTAVECAMTLHPTLAGRLDDVDEIIIRTHEAAIRIIDKSGPLRNPADRDHCIQYMIAVPLIHGRLTAPDYEDDVACDPRIDALRAKMRCIEDTAFTEAYHDPARRSIPNSIMIRFKDGSWLPEVVVEYPIGHRRRRTEAIPLLKEKVARNLRRIFSPAQAAAIQEASGSARDFDLMPVCGYVNLYVPSSG